jgi:hypothetical protein
MPGWFRIVTIRKRTQVIAACSKWGRVVESREIQAGAILIAVNAW